MNVTRTSLNAGELTDELAGRIDITKVQMGLERAENLRVLRVGGVTRRAGYRLGGLRYDQARPSRMQGFRFGDQQGYGFEFSHYKMRLWRDGKLVGDVPEEATLTVVGMPLIGVPEEVIPATPINNRPAWSTNGGSSFPTDDFVLQVAINGAGKWEITGKAGGVPVVAVAAAAGFEYPWEVTAWLGYDVEVLLPMGFQEVHLYTTPWSADQVFALDFAQRVNTIVVTHGDVDTQLMTFDETTQKVTIEVYPWVERVWEEHDPNQTILLTPSATTGAAAITASVGIFTPDWIGTRLRLGQIRSENTFRSSPQAQLQTAVAFVASSGVYAAGTLIYFATSSRPSGKYVGVIVAGNRSFWRVKANYNGPGGCYVPGNTHPDNYPTFFDQGGIVVPVREVRGSYSFETYDTWLGTYVVERSYNNGATWESVKILQSFDGNNKNYLLQEKEDVGANAKFRVLVLDFENSMTNVKFQFTVASATLYGVGKIIAYTSPTVVGVTIETPFESTSPTGDWYEDAFNPKNGYAKACTYHQKRLWLGGSRRRRSTVWASRVKKPFDFTQGTLADDGMSFETDAEGYEEVLKLVSHLSLLVGTTSSIWAISSPNGLSITPENNANNRQVSFGVAPGIAMIPIQSNVAVLQTKGRKIHELVGGSVDYGGYTSNDMTQLASHITRGGVKQMASGSVPDSTLYVVSGSELATLTYERSQNVVGWTRWLTSGVINSVGVCAGAGEDDNIYIDVTRGTQGFIEFHTPDMLRIEEDNNVDDLAFLDSYIEKAAGVTPFTEFTGLGVHEGRMLGVFADGEPVGNFLVGGGKIILPRAITKKAIAGIPYVSLAQTMPLDQGTIGNRSSINEVTIRFRNTLGAKVSTDRNPVPGTGNWSKMDFASVATDNLPFNLQSGDHVTTPHSSWVKKPSVTIIQDDMLPMTILSVRITGKTSNT